MGTPLFKKTRNHEIWYRPGKALRDDLSLILGLVSFTLLIMWLGKGMVGDRRVEMHIAHA